MSNDSLNIKKLSDGVVMLSEMKQGFSTVTFVKPDEVVFQLRFDANNTDDLDVIIDRLIAIATDLSIGTVVADDKEPF